MPSPRSFLSRRSFLAGAAGAIGTAALAGSLQRKRAAAATDESHLVWVWQFTEDGEAARIRDSLASHGLGILMKTHDGTRWMNRFDKSPMAIGGATTVRETSLFFEKAGVPFHAWCVVQGYDPIEEARMCAEVLSNGARSMTIDLEPPDEGHYWQATKSEALAFGRELRRLVPDAHVSVSPDPRPWQLDSIPMSEFASFSNQLKPQTYWETFNSRTNLNMLRDRGFYAGEEGVTPELILDVSQNALGRYQLPIHPVGQGNANPLAWQRFLSHSQNLGMPGVSVWRYGTMASTVMPMLVRPAPVFGPPVESASFFVPAAAPPVAVMEPPVAPPVPAPPAPENVVPAPAEPPASSTPPVRAAGGEAAPLRVNKPRGFDRWLGGDRRRFAPQTVTETSGDKPSWRWLLPDRSTK